MNNPILLGQATLLPKKEKRDPMRNIEKYTFPLLCRLMDLEHLNQITEQRYGGWMVHDLPQGDSSKEVLSRLCGGGSDNHPYLLMACALWWLPGTHTLSGTWRQAWVDLLSFQTTGRCPWDGMQELALWEHNETHSTTYSSFRWVSVLAVWKWARDHHDALLAGLCETYCQAMAAWWGLGAVLPWKGLTERENAKGEPYDGTLLVPACGERSTLAHAYQNDLGTLLANAEATPHWSKRLNPYVRMILEGMGHGYASRGISATGHGQSLWGSMKERAEFLQRLGIRTNREIVWEFWKDVTLVYCPGPRLNGNTRDTKYWIAIPGKEVVVGFPWQGGRGDSTKGQGGDCYRSPEGIIAKGNIGVDLFYPTPLRSPDLKIVINREGVKIS